MSIWAQYVAEPKNVGFSNSLDPYVFGFVATLFLKYFQEKKPKNSKKTTKTKKKSFLMYLRHFQLFQRHLKRIQISNIFSIHSSFNTLFLTHYF
jgi:hypothetical protein